MVPIAPTGMIYIYVLAKTQDSRDIAVTSYNSSNALVLIKLLNQPLVSQINGSGTAAAALK